MSKADEFSDSFNKKKKETLGDLAKSILDGKTHKEFFKTNSILKSRKDFSERAKKLNCGVVNSLKRVSFSKKVFVLRFKTQGIDEKYDSNDVFLKNLKKQKSNFSKV